MTKPAQIDLPQETLYRSDNPKDLIAFYRSFDSFVELSRFFAHQPQAATRLVHYPRDGDLSCIAVVPTADVDGLTATGFLQSFPGLNTFLVESRGEGFNFARSMNKGIEAALDAGAEWVLLANDDLRVCSNHINWKTVVQNLSDESWICPKVFNGRHPQPSSWGLGVLDSKDLVWRLWRFFRGRSADDASTFGIFLREAERFHLPPILAVRCKPTRGITDRLLLRRTVPSIKPFHSVQPITILRRGVARHPWFDDRFVNASEDTDLSLRLIRQGVRPYLIDVRLNTPIGSTLGRSRQRWLRYNLYGNLAFANKHGHELLA
jgi:GT2 family glycosyltransferase